MAASGGGADVEEHPRKLKLYSYWLSSCSFRVRIALNLKGLHYEYKAVNLAKGEHFSPEFSNLNPVNYVPVLVDGDVVVADSFAIIMYLEEKYPEHPLLPSDLQKKAINFQAANIVSSSIQPLHKLAVVKFAEGEINSEEKLSWVGHFIKKGFTDLFLAPQIDAAIKRFNVDMAEFPLLYKLNEAYSELPAFLDAMIEKQPDAPI